MSSVFQFVAVLLFLHFANFAQAEGDLCANLTPIKNFNISAYLGQWYENQRYEKVGAEHPKCVSSNSKFSDNGDGSIESVFYEIDTVNDTPRSFTNKGKLIQESVGRFTIKFPAVSKLADGQYTILDTDYDSYALISSCKNGYLKGDTNVLAWAYTRQAVPDDSVVQQALKAAEKAGFVTSKFTKIEQEGCDTPTTEDQKEEAPATGEAAL